MGVRLYGSTEGWGSYAQVSKGFELALREHGVLEGLVAVDQGFDLDEQPPPGASAQNGVFTGPPPSVVQLKHNAMHERRFGMLTPNSDRVPAAILANYEATCTDLMAPSEWGADVLRKLTSYPVHCVPHGLHPAFAPNPEWREAVTRSYHEGHFRVLHLSTSPRERKSTLQLVQAWVWLANNRALPPQSQLTLLLDPRAAASFLDRLGDYDVHLPESVRLVYRLEAGYGAPPGRMAQVLSEYHLVCQPSRAEGFGLVPLEARACGVPVLATACTGHSQHMPQTGAPFEQGVGVIEHGPDAPIDDMPEAVAPSVSEHAIGAAIEVAYDSWLELSGNALAKAESVRTVWSWPKQLEPFVRLLEA